MNRAKLEKAMEFFQEKRGKWIVAQYARTNTLGRLHLIFTVPVLVLPVCIYVAVEKSFDSLWQYGTVGGFVLLIACLGLTMALWGRKTVFDPEARTIRGRGRNLTFDDVDSVRLHPAGLELALRSEPDNALSLVKSKESARVVRAALQLAEKLGVTLEEREPDRQSRIPAKSLGLTLTERLSQGMQSAPDPGPAPAKVSATQGPGRLAIRWSGVRSARLALLAVLIFTGTSVYFLVTLSSSGRSIARLAIYLLPMAAMIPAVLRGSTGGEMVVTPDRITLQKGRVAKETKGIPVNEIRWITASDKNDQISVIALTGTQSVVLPAGSVDWSRRRIEHFLMANASNRPEGV